MPLSQKKEVQRFANGIPKKNERKETAKVIDR